MASIRISGPPEAEPVAEPWPADEHTIRADEMFARKLDTEFATGVRTPLHDPTTGLSSLEGEAALEAIAGVYPALEELRQRTLGEAIGPRQRSLVEPAIDARLDWAAGTIGRLAERATVQVDDQSVAERLAGLRQDAESSWQDPGLDSFDAIEGRPPNSGDIDGIIREAVSVNSPAENAPHSTAEWEASNGDLEPFLGALDTERQAEDPTDRPYSEGSQPSIEVASTEVARADQSVDLSSAPFAGDPNVIPVAGGTNSSRRGGSRPLTHAEQVRSENFQSALTALRALEPNNRELTQIAPRGWIPG